VNVWARIPYVVGSTRKRTGSPEAVREAAIRWAIVVGWVVTAPSSSQGTDPGTYPNIRAFSPTEPSATAKSGAPEPSRATSAADVS